MGFTNGDFLPDFITPPDIGAMYLSLQCPPLVIPVKRKIMLVCMLDLIKFKNIKSVQTRKDHCRIFAGLPSWYPSPRLLNAQCSRNAVDSRITVSQKGGMNPDFDS